MYLLIVEEYVRAERLENLALLNTAKEERLVNTNVPCSESADNALVRGSVSGGNESGADRNAFTVVKALLNQRNGL